MSFLIYNVNFESQPGMNWLTGSQTLLNIKDRYLSEIWAVRLE